MKPTHRNDVIRRLRIARGHLDGVVRMVEDDAYCPEVMKQLAAVQGSLQQASRQVLRNHLETCVADAMRAGRGDESVDGRRGAPHFDRRPAGTAREGART